MAYIDLKTEVNPGIPNVGYIRIWGENGYFKVKDENGNIVTLDTSNVVGDMISTNNLGDIADVDAARTNLQLGNHVTFDFKSSGGDYGTQSNVARGDHMHNTLYYTKAELSSGQLNNLYYTEDELDNGALDGRYYTQTELNNGQLDNRYYTESEVDSRIKTESLTIGTADYVTPKDLTSGFKSYNGIILGNDTSDGINNPLPSEIGKLRFRTYGFVEYLELAVVGSVGSTTWKTIWSQAVSGV